MRNSTSHCLLLRPHFIHAPSAATAKQPQHHHENNIITPKCVCLPPSTHSRIVILLLLLNPHPSTHDGTPKSGSTLWLAFVVGLPRSLNPNGDIFRAVICARIIVIYEGPSSCQPGHHATNWWSTRGWFWDDFDDGRSLSLCSGFCAVVSNRS